MLPPRLADSPRACAVTPDGPGPLSWYGVVHVGGFALAMVSWTAATVVLARARAVVCVAALVVAVANLDWTKK